VTLDLSPSRRPADLVDAIWEARRTNRRDLCAQVVGLLNHESPTVREEALSLLFEKWKEEMLRERLLELLRLDADFGVRARAANALAALSSETTRRADLEMLSRLILNRREDAIVRKSAYEALHRLAYGKVFLLDDDTDLDEDCDLDWVRAICEKEGRH
jgi:HEAT repeat protein